MCCSAGRKRCGKPSVDAANAADIAVSPAAKAAPGNSTRRVNVCRDLRNGRSMKRQDSAASPNESAIKAALAVPLGSRRSM
jgi:hypothetical protein